MHIALLRQRRRDFGRGGERASPLLFVLGLDFVKLLQPRAKPVSFRLFRPDLKRRRHLLLKVAAVAKSRVSICPRLRGPPRLLMRPFLAALLPILAREELLDLLPLSLETLLEPLPLLGYRRRPRVLPLAFGNLPCHLLLTVPLNLCLEVEFEALLLLEPLLLFQLPSRLQNLQLLLEAVCLLEPREFLFEAFLLLLELCLRRPGLRRHHRPRSVDASACLECGEGPGGHEAASLFRGVRFRWVALTVWLAGGSGGRSPRLITCPSPVSVAGIPPWLPLRSTLLRGPAHLHQRQKLASRDRRRNAP
mmetsp:Transcript_60728/g.144508  ORF Transcript_60728/g.144508 Transcript_60728/m.144508 type:complete len:306 (-) Transcript_60728:748-1665(-)